MAMTLSKSVAVSARALLDRLLDRPSPLALVQSLSAETVLGLIERVGLEDLGELLGLLSPAQLTHVLDQDLWQSPAPGRDARFDAQRFALWLALLLEQSPELALQKLRELDFELVAFGFSQQLFVIDMDQLAEAVLHMASDDEQQLDKALEADLYHEFEQYRVFARDARSFDALLTILVELNSHDYNYLCALLERCCVISQDYIDDNGGLYEVLSAAETIEADVAGEREERREQRGFVASSSALAFLRLARETPLAELLADDAPDPLTRAHFRAAASSPPFSRAPSSGQVEPRLLAANETDPKGETRLLQELEASLAEQPRRVRSLPRARGRASLLASALTELCARDVTRYERCLMEASYLANVLWAGVGSSDERFAPSEAAEIALAVCDLGATELVADLAPAARAAALGERLSRAGLVKLFQIGFQRLCASDRPAAVQKTPSLLRLHRLVAAQWSDGRPQRARQRSARDYNLRGE
jgi:hypothetical protein